MGIAEREGASSWDSSMAAAAFYILDGVVY
jgi:hypothetical protein